MSEKYVVNEVCTDFIQTCMRCGTKVEGKPLGYRLDDKSGRFKVDYVQYPHGWSGFGYVHQWPSGGSTTFYIPFCPSCSGATLRDCRIDVDRLVSGGYATPSKTYGRVRVIAGSEGGLVADFCGPGWDKDGRVLVRYDDPTRPADHLRPEMMEPLDEDAKALLDVAHAVWKLSQRR